MEEERKYKRLKIGPFKLETWRFPERPWDFSGFRGRSVYVTLFGRVFWLDWYNFEKYDKKQAA